MTPLDRSTATKPFSLRLTLEERAELERRAAGQPLSTYARERLLADRAQVRRTRGKAPVKDHQELAQLLAKLGQSRLASNLNQLARAANAGALSLSPETVSLLREAAHDIAAMKAMLMAALGVQER